MFSVLSSAPDPRPFSVSIPGSVTDTNFAEDSKKGGRLGRSRTLGGEGDEKFQVMKVNRISGSLGYAREF